MRFALAVVIVASSSSLALAETDVEKADRLFKEGREHLKQQKYAQACDAFEESQRLDPQLGVLFNLASCREKTGKLATALELYRELARTDTNEERRKTSEQRAASIALRVPKLVVKVEAASGLAITVDGKDATPMRGIGMPIDLGKHTVTIRAVGFQDWTREVIVRDEKKTVEVPVTMAPVGAPVPVDQGPIVPMPIDDEPATPAKVTYGKWLVYGGAGVTVVGLAFGALAMNNWNDVKDVMPADDMQYRSAQERVDRARLWGNLSTVTVSVGLVAAGIGTYLWITGRKQAVVAAPESGGGTVSFVGTF